jgi:GTP cyclohydrolase I
MVIAPWEALDDEDAPLQRHNGAARDLRVEKIAAHVRGIIDALGLDRSDPNLAETDRRVAKAYLELFAGLEPDAEPVLTTFPNDPPTDEMVAVIDIPFYSLCAHHFLPFHGRAHVAYLPGEQIVGLSKLARAVEFFARRPQVQERLTEQVADFLEDRLDPRGVAVAVEATHFCMEMRGTQKPGALTLTSTTRGAFKDAALRAEFFQRIRRNG